MRRSWLAMATTGLALLSCVPAMAAQPEVKRDWWLLNFGTGQCEKGSKIYHQDTPDQ